MARPLRWALLLLLLCGSAFGQSQLAPIPALDSPVVDTTGTLDAARRGQLEQQALALQQRKGSQLQVLMVPTTAPETIETYAVRAFEQWKLGREGVDDGVLLVVAKDDRKVRIEVGYGLEGAIPDITAGRVVQEYLAPKFREGDYGGGIADGTAALVGLIDGEPLPAPVSSHRSGDGDGSWMPALIVAFFVATFVRGLFGRTSAGIRGLVTAGAAGGAAWLVSALLPAALVGGGIGLLMGLMAGSGGRYARHGGWGGWGGGGGGFPGGGWGGSGTGGGGWSGGGGMSGGGGASGSW